MAFSGRTNNVTNGFGRYYFAFRNPDYLLRQDDFAQIFIFKKVENIKLTSVQELKKEVL